MSTLTNYRTPTAGFELLQLTLQHPKDAEQYLEILKLSQLLQSLRGMQEFTPAIFLGLLDTSPTKTVTSAYRVWQFDEDCRHVLLVAGQHAQANNRHLLGADNLRRLLPDNPGLELYSQVAADSTPEQAIWLCDRVEELSLKAVALHVPEFHAPRAFATVVAEMYKRDIYFDLLPWPRVLVPDVSYPLAGFADRAKSIELLAGEFKRFINYRGQGVASHETVDDYLCRFMNKLEDI